MAATFSEECRIWDVPRAGFIENVPVTSTIPALLLTGEFDPITSPLWARDAALTLTASTVVLFPDGGHGVLYGSECAGQIASAFLEAPTVEIDRSCVSELGPPRFEP
jgi:pimeloyl-ACP methyl ester carboxylesterase